MNMTQNQNMIMNWNTMRIMKEQMGIKILRKVDMRKVQIMIILLRMNVKIKSTKVKEQKVEQVAKKTK